jgi:hypothetical protein
MGPIHIDPLSGAVVRVVPKYRDLKLAPAAAFTVAWGARLFLITARQVVTGRDPDTGRCLDSRQFATPHQLAVQFHSAGTLGTWRPKLIELYGLDGAPRWVEHPAGPHIDVVALPLGDLGGAEAYPLDLSLAAAEMLPLPGMPVSLLSFPNGCAAGGGWPLWKGGQIASDPELDIAPGRPAFLVDAGRQEGLSGAPVLLRLERYPARRGDKFVNVTGWQTRFLGVYGAPGTQGSGLGHVWRPAVITEILQAALARTDAAGAGGPRRLDPCPCGSGRRFKDCHGRLRA